MAVDDVVAMRLEAAAAHAEAEAWGDAAEELVAAWQLAPMTKVAELVVACDARVPVAGIAAKKISDREAAWTKLAEQLDAANLRVLLATPWPVHPSVAIERVIVLERYPAHPRISQALFGLHVRRQYPSAVGRKVSRRAFRLLIAQGDPVVAEYIATIAASTSLADRNYASGTLGSLMTKRVPVPRVPAPRDAAAIARIVAVTTSATAATDAQSREDLLAAVYAAPFDDAPREVLADLSTELGDPHGELITLQLQRARGTSTAKTIARERSLLRAAGKSWNRDLESDGAFDIELGRGFPVRAKTRETSFAVPGWATVEEVAIVSPAKFAMTDVPNLRALRVLRGVPRGMLGAVVPPVPDQLHELIVDGDVGLARDTVLAPRVFGIDRVPEAQLPAMAQQLAKWPIGRRVVELSVAAYINSLSLVFEILAVANLETVTLLGSQNRDYLHPQRWWARASRDRLVLGWFGDGYHAAAEIKRIVTVLGALTARPIVTTVEIVSAGKSAAAVLPKTATAVADIIATWPRAPKLIVNGVG